MEVVTVNCRKAHCDLEVNETILNIELISKTMFRRTVEVKNKEVLCTARKVFSF